MFYLYSSVRYLQQLSPATITEVHAIGQDAYIPAEDVERELVIFVLGETARADHFSLNGYAKQTNPLLSKEAVISFPHMESCGTSTDVSVPCMFSGYGRSQFDNDKGRSTENLLDVLTRAGVHVLWRDNNSDSKGVALRVPYEDFKTPKKNHHCDVECRDEGMLEGLQAFIDQHPKGDIMIILHQMGNHGPAYYKRYPKSFERFTPACQSNQLDECSAEEINNAYDNAILYTDHFLSSVIDLLKQNDPSFETAMVYVSDHGESLGEKGVYLHGMPWFMAPDAQKNPAAVMWFGKHYDDIDKLALKSRANKAVSHDNMFHTLLGMMEVQTDLYKKEMDIITHTERTATNKLPHQANERRTLPHPGVQPLLQLKSPIKHLGRLGASRNPATICKKMASQDAIFLICSNTFMTRPLSRQAMPHAHAVRAWPLFQSDAQSSL